MMIQTTRIGKANIHVKTFIHRESLRWKLMAMLKAIGGAKHLEKWKWKGSLSHGRSYFRAT